MMETKIYRTKPLSRMFLESLRIEKLEELIETGECGRLII